jgi:hypothetical protein
MSRKHVHASSCRNVVPTESHNDGQNAGYFPRTLRTMLLALGSSGPPLFIRTPRLLRRNSYLWRVCVVIYERPTRWTFEADMREAAREALTILRHEVDE